MPQAKITVAEAVQKPTKSGKLYLNVKSGKGAYFNCWLENQYIWHKFVVGQDVEIYYTDDGKFKTITGVVGMEAPVAEKVDNWGDQFTALAERVSKLERQIADVIATDVPKLSELPVINLEDKDEIKPEELFN
jgi:hypothetical protein